MTFKEYKKAAFEENPALKAEYDALAPQYELIKKVISAHTEQNIGQAELGKEVSATIE